MAGTKVEFEIIGKDSASKVFVNVSKEAESFGQKMSNIGQIAGGFVVGQALTQLPGMFMDAAKAAVSLEQNAKKAATVFGESLPMVEEWADTSAAAMGLTDDQATTLATSMADLLIPMGMTREQAAEMSTETIGLAGALAEWSGGTVSASQAADIMTKAMLGETDGLKALGISISAADISARLAAKGQSELTGAALAQAEALAVQELIFEKSTDAQTAFAEGAGTTARAQAEATAAMAEAKEQLSTALLPAMTLATNVFAAFAILLSTQVMPAILSIVSAFGPVVNFIQDNLAPSLVILGTGLTVLAMVAIPALITAIQAKVVALYQMAAAWVVANTSMLPIIALVVAIGVAVAALVYAWQNNLLGIQDHTQRFVDWFLPIWNSTWAVIQQVIDTVWPYISMIVTTYIAILKKEIEIGLAVVQAVFNTVFPIIQSIVQTVFPIIAQIVTTYIAILRTEIEIGVAAARFAFDNVFVPIQGIVSDVFTTIAGIVSTVWGPAVAAIGIGVETVKSMFDGLVYIQGVFSDVFTTIAGLAETLWNLGAVLSVATGMGTLKGIFEGAYKTFYGFGSSVFEGLRDGMAGVVSFVNGIIDGILAAYNRIPEFLRPGSPSKWAREQSKSLVDGLVLELLAGIPRVQAAVDGINKTLAGAGSLPWQDTPWYNPGTGTSPLPWQDTPWYNPGPVTPSSPWVDTPWYGHGSPPTTAPPPVIGDAVSGTVPPLGIYNPPGNGGGIGMMPSASDIERAVERGVKRGLGSAM